MTKAGCWFGWAKGFFIFESKTKGRKRSRRWRWIFRRLKRKSYPSIVAPEKRSLSEATEERRKHALTVAIATAAAAEAAVAAAHAAAEVVRLTTSSQSLRIFSKTDQNSAAVKIQSAFRAHLARKALRALKGLVRLQAISRGRAVRRRINASLNQTRAETKGQPERPGKGTLTGQENELKIENICKRNWDGSILSKEEMEFSWLRKQEAIMKRERMKKYSFSHREKRNVRFLEETASNRASRPETSFFSGSTAQFQPENERTQSCLEELRLGRRSFSHVKHNSAGDESLMPGSPVFPSYMAATESVKAKTRSTSLPKQRTGLLDAYSHCSFSSRDEPGSWLSCNGGLARYA